MQAWMSSADKQHMALQSCKMPGMQRRHGRRRRPQRSRAPWRLSSSGGRPAAGGVSRGCILSRKVHASLFYMTGVKELSSSVHEMGNPSLLLTGICSAVVANAKLV